MSQRERFVEWALSQLGKPVLWGAKGPLVFDCSGLVTYGWKQVGLPDHREDWSALKMLTQLTPLTAMDEALPGDICGYGIRTSPHRHVAIYLESGGVISASGASQGILTLDDAFKHGARVRRFKSYRYRDDFLGFWRAPFDDEEPTEEA